MADNNYNIIKPVEAMQNIVGLSPARRRQERKRRPPGERKKQTHELAEEPNQLNNGEKMKPESATDKNDPHTIDYRA